jgi:hypothetical protein
MADWLSRRPAGWLPTPGIVPRINRRHPAAQGLVGLWFPAGGSLILDLTGNMPPLLPLRAGIANGVGPTGYQAQDTVTGTSYWVSTAVPAAQKPTAAFSLLYLSVELNTAQDSADNPMIFGVAWQTATSPFISWGLVINQANGLFYAGWNYSGTEQTTSSYPASGTVPTGAPVTVVSAVTLGGEFAFWVDRTLYESGSANSGSIEYASSPAFYLGGGGFGANSNAGFGFSLGALWNRALTAGEAQSLSADPWQLLEWPFGRVPLQEIAQSLSSTAITADAAIWGEFLLNVIEPGVFPDYLDTGYGSWLDTGDGSYLDTGLNPAGGWAPFEFLARGIADTKAPVETGTTSGGSDVSDSFAPVELGTGVPADAIAPTALGATVPADAMAPAESGESVWLDRPMPAESGERVVRDAPPAAESGETVRADPPAPAEATAAQRIDAEAPTESQGAAVFVVDTLYWLEFLRTQAGDAAAAVEGAALFRADTNDPAEAAALLRADMPPPGESIAVFRLDVASPGEAGASQVIDRMAVLEALASAVRDGGEIESVALTRVDQPPTAEATATQRIVPGVPTEDAGTQAVDWLPPVEFLLVAARDGADETEFLGAVQYFIDPSAVAGVEWAANFAADRLTAAEWTALSESDQTAILEWLRGQAPADAYAPIEFGQTNPPPLFLLSRGRLR